MRTTEKEKLLIIILLFKENNFDLHFITSFIPYK